MKTQIRCLYVIEVRDSPGLIVDLRNVGESARLAVFESLPEAREEMKKLRTLVGPEFKRRTWHIVRYDRVAIRGRARA